jgi:outer membrane protein assembly factor BamB
VYTDIDGALQAQTIGAGLVEWTFTGDGRLDTSPIVVNGSVYVGSASGHLYAVSAATGTRQWSTTLTSAVTGPLAEGDGVLCVPAGDTLTVFTPSR